MQQTNTITRRETTPETVSPTANWPKPVYKPKLKLKRRVNLRDGFGTRSICPPTKQPKLNRIRANEDELLDAINSLNASAETTRKLHAQIFNGLISK